MAILSTGKEMRKFKNGAVRDNVEGKGRCDLLPFRILWKLTGDDIYKYADDYIYTGQLCHIADALNSFISRYYNGCWETAILDVSKQYEDGAKKYADRNWQRGINLHCFIDSGMRHYLKFKRGDKDENHDKAFVWNMLGALWTQDNHPDLCDLPFADDKAESS